MGNSDSSTGETVMQFSSFNEFIAMGNHGLYVWISYGFTFVCLAILILLSLRTQKAIKQNVLKKLRRDAKLQQAQEKYEQRQIDNTKDIEL